VGSVVAAQPDHVIEPSAGHGVWLRSYHAAHPGERRYTAVELDRSLETVAALRGLAETMPLRVVHGRFQRFDERGEADLVIGNPPYTQTAEFVEQAHFALRPGGLCALLLRLNFLGGKGRHWWWRRYPICRFYTLSGRPDFTGEGGDATEYALFVWKKGYRGFQGHHHIAVHEDLDPSDDLREIREQDWPILIE
jgi:hypothetical protein